MVSMEIIPAIRQKTKTIFSVLIGVVTYRLRNLTASDRKRLMYFKKPSYSSSSAETCLGKLSGNNADPRRYLLTPKKSSFALIPLRRLYVYVYERSPHKIEDRKNTVVSASRQQC